MSRISTIQISTFFFFGLHYNFKVYDLDRKKGLHLRILIVMQRMEECPPYKMYVKCLFTAVYCHYF